jgi:1,4-dihydroxy-2-naphthoyl-CoA hydrolase
VSGPSSAGWDRARRLAAPEPRFVQHLSVPFHHIDAAGIVFYARVLEWFHDLYVAALAAADHDLPSAIRERRWMAPLVHAAADYLAPLRFGDPITVGLVGADVTESRVSLGYRVTTTAADRQIVAAVGTTVHVFVDPETFARTSMPADLRTWFETLNGPR